MVSLSKSLVLILQLIIKFVYLLIFVIHHIFQKNYWNPAWISMRFERSLNEDLATSVTKAVPFTDVVICVPVVEAQILEYFGAKVTIEEACVNFHVVVQTIISVELLATLCALCVAFIFSGCFSTSSCVAVSKDSSSFLSKFHLSINFCS